MKDDGEIQLKRYVESGSEAAFAAVVNAYGEMVYAEAVRRTGDGALAEEAVQNVFVLLVRKAEGLVAKPGLAAWLHRAAVLESENFVRSELNRKRKMDAYQEEQNEEAGEEVERLRPVLDGLGAGGQARWLMKEMLLQAYAEQNVYEALAYADERGVLREAMSYIGRSVKADDLGAFFAVLRALPEVGAYRSQYCSDFAVKMNHSHGWEAARAFVEKYGEDVSWPGGLAAGVAAADMRDRPEEKLRWVVEMSGANHGGRNLEAVVGAWTEVDTGAVAECLGTVGDEPWRHAAAATFVKKVTPVDPREAAEWAGTIRDRKVRARLVRELGGS